jgi:glycosyltransferase involved in cell wall biosynthesis
MLSNAQPFFSVIMPVFNGAETIEKTLGYLSNQSFTGFEIIVVDDGSADETSAVVENCNLDNLRYVFQHRLGVSAARNKGASIAKGDFLVFLDSDDMVMPEWLADFHSSLDQSNCELCFCGSSFDFGRVNVSGRENFLAGTFCIKKELFRRAGGYDERLKHSENTELGWRVIDLNPRVAFVDKINFRYQRSGRNGLSYLTNRLKAFEVIKVKHADRFKKNPQLGQTYYQVAAVDACRIGDFEKCKKLMWQGYWFQPLNFKALLRAICTVFTPVSEFIWKPIKLVYAN